MIVDRERRKLFTELPIKIYWVLRAVMIQRWTRLDSYPPGE
jgi:hypothetical protein